jgi:hypothetical protein
VLRIFNALKNPSPWPGFEPAIFGSSGQHTNHYTNKATGRTDQECMILAGKPEGQIQVGIPRRKWMDNIKTDLNEIRVGTDSLSGSGQGILTGSCEYDNKRRCWYSGS